MNKQNQTRLVLISFLILGCVVGVSMAAVPQSTLRTTGAGITTYVGHFGNFTQGIYQGAIERLSPTGEATFFTVEADQYFLSTVNKTDIFAYPQQEASYIIWTDGTNYYAKNGTTGNIDYSGTDAVVDVIQPSVDSIDALEGGYIHLKSGTYVSTTTLWVVEGLAIMGDGVEATLITQSIGGTHDIIGFNESVDSYFFYLGYLKISGTNGLGGVGVNMTHPSNSFDMWDGRMEFVFISSMNKSGIELNSPWGWALDQVVSEFNGEYGLIVNGGSHLKIVNSKFMANDLSGISIASRHNAITASIFADNEQHGLLVTDRGTKIENCEITGNSNTPGYYGLSLSGSNCIINGNFFSGGAFQEGAAQENRGVYITGSYNIITDNEFYGPWTAEPIRTFTTSNYNTVKDNEFFNLANNPILDQSSTSRLNTLTLSFVDGTTFLSTAPFGWEIDVNTEYAIVLGFLPQDVHGVVRWRIGATSLVNEADAMRLEIEGYGGASNEPYTTETVSLANHPSETTNFAINDVIYWTLTASDEADIDDMVGGDQIMIKVLHEAAGGDDAETDAVFTSIIIDYV